MRSGNSRSGAVKSNRTERGPVCVIRATLSHATRYRGRPFSARVCMDHMTSSTVTGLPSEKRASGRSTNSTQDRASSVSIDSARSPYRENGSSQLRAMRVSKTRV